MVPHIKIHIIYFISLWIWNFITGINQFNFNPLPMWKVVVTSATQQQPLNTVTYDCGLFKSVFFHLSKFSQT